MEEEEVLPGISETGPAHSGPCPPTCPLSHPPHTPSPTHTRSRPRPFLPYISTEAADESLFEFISVYVCVFVSSLRRCLCLRISSCLHLLVRLCLPALCVCLHLCADTRVLLHAPVLRPCYCALSGTKICSRRFLKPLRQHGAMLALAPCCLRVISKSNDERRCRSMPRDGC